MNGVSSSLLSDCDDSGVGTRVPGRSRVPNRQRRCLFWLVLRLLSQFAKSASTSNSSVSSSPPSSHLLCCKLVWIDTVGLHHCLDN
jgi:hypothetical protein